MTGYEAIVRVSLICLGFALVHSVCVMSWVKVLAGKVSGQEAVRAYYRLGYTCFSFVAVFIAVYLIVLVPDVDVWRAPVWLRWPMHAVQASALLFAMLSFRGFSSGEFIGVSQALRYLLHKKVSGDAEGLTGAGIIKTGTYGLVRHPLYAAGVAIFSFEPNLTRSWLVVSVFSVLYFIYGAFMEERRLIKRFGQEYRQYMREVPMFVPRLKRGARRA